eukprot:766474-Hanusia_phi.AAC.2
MATDLQHEAKLASKSNIIPRHEEEAGGTRRTRTRMRLMRSTKQGAMAASLASGSRRVLKEAKSVGQGGGGEGGREGGGAAAARTIGSEQGIEVLVPSVETGEPRDQLEEADRCCCSRARAGGAGGGEGSVPVLAPLILPQRGQTPRNSRRPGGASCAAWVGAAAGEEAMEGKGVMVVQMKTMMDKKADEQKQSSLYEYVG